MRTPNTHSGVQVEAAAYQVVDGSGQVFGPVDRPTIYRWVEENRVTPDMLILDETGARHTPEEFFRPSAVAVATAIADVEVPGYREEAPKPFPGLKAATRGQRIGGFLVDFAIAFALYNALDFTLGLLFMRVNSYDHWAVHRYMPYIYPVILTAYMVGRDCLLPNGSIGKRAVGIRVAKKIGKLTLSDSIRRNLVFLPIMLLPFRFGPYVGAPLLIGFGIAELLTMLGSGKRWGDTFSGTKVVQG